MANEYTPDNKKPLEVAALIKPGVYNYRGRKVDLTSYDKAAEKTAGIINSMRGGISMELFNKKNNKKAAAKVKPKAEITFVEMVCPGCGGAVNLNPDTGETFAGSAQQKEPQGGNEPAATLARRMPGNVKAAIYSVTCPHCGEEFVWDTDANSDGEPGQQTTETVPVGNAATPPANATAPAAELVEASCPNCGAAVEYDTDTAETGTDEAGNEGYALTCPECNTPFIEPYAASEPTAVPVAATIEAQAAYRAGVLAERNRILALDEMAAAAPAQAAMIQAAKRTGASATVMSRREEVKYGKFVQAEC